MYEINGNRTENTQSDAIVVARYVRRKDRIAVTVIDTDTSETVFYLPAPKAIRQIPKYTRVVTLPYGLQVPDCMRAAYLHVRSNGAILYDHEARVYRIMDLRTGKLLKATFKTASAAGDRASQGVGGRRIA